MKWKGCEGRLDSVNLWKRSLGRRSGLYRRRLDNQRRENTCISKQIKDVESKHGELLSHQQEMIDKAFTLIMTEVWSIDPELAVPRVEKWVNKSVILKAIEDKRVIQTPPSRSPQQSFGCPKRISLLVGLFMRVAAL